ncbi:hypothetical protein [Pseudomonas sp. PH1b]|uniref:hypothetical protein n=1 Tax=Pseudomonas sp. PH1b TaxID=1397282 RepID=UPI000469A7B4|nr:hypothetical protein [Pseudomonas sp. PH1b]
MKIFFDLTFFNIAIFCPLRPPLVGTSGSSRQRLLQTLTALIWISIERRILTEAQDMKIADWR